MNNCKLCPVALGLSLGVIWGVSVFFIGMVAHFYLYGRPFVEALGVLYIGYDPSIAGCVIGGLIGFLDAFLGGLIIAWLYNVFSNCTSKKEG